MLKKMLFSCFALIGLAGYANSADLNIVPVPAYVPTWTGCYLGGHAGYGAMTTSSYYAYPNSSALAGDGFYTTGEYIHEFNNKGFAGGGQVGCQLQRGMFLWGLEGDWTSFSNASNDTFASAFSDPGGNFSQTTQQSMTSSALWSVRGRFGMILYNDYHVYATVGVGGARTRYAYASSMFMDAPGFVPEGVSTTASVTLQPTGFVVGAGAEWKIWPNVIVGAEYLHYDLTSDNVVLPLFNTNGPLLSLAAVGDHIRNNNVDVVRLRASWLFNLWH
jgi:outer membrane immunogenic protein